MDAAESSTSPYSPPSLRHKLRTTVCGCFGSPSSPGSSGERPQSGGRARWRRRVAAAGEFRYDPLSYALNFDEGHGASPEGPGGEFPGYPDFSPRFAAPPGSARSSMDLGSRDAPSLVHHPLPQQPHTPPAAARG